MIHQLSSVHADAQLAAGVEIGPFTTISEDVIIGKKTWIGPNVTIMPGARIGANCRIFPGAVISAIPQDLKFDGESSTVEIGDRTLRGKLPLLASESRGETIETEAVHCTHIGRNPPLNGF